MLAFDWPADKAVHCEPVWPRLPCKQGIHQGNLQTRRCCDVPTVQKFAESMAWSEIPCEIEQGISGRASGKVFWQTMEIGADTGAQSAEVRVSIAAI
jgi:hypothetical protein